MILACCLSLPPSRQQISLSFFFSFLLFSATLTTPPRYPRINPENHHPLAYDRSGTSLPTHLSTIDFAPFRHACAYTHTCIYIYTFRHLFPSRSSSLPRLCASSTLDRPPPVPFEGLKGPFASVADRFKENTKDRARCFKVCIAFTSLVPELFPRPVHKVTCIEA